MSKQPRVSLSALIASEVAPRATAPDPVETTVETRTAVPPEAPPPVVVPPEVPRPAPLLRRPVESKPGRGTTLRSRAKQLSLYLEIPVYDQLREIAHTERCKMHQLVIEGIDLLLKKRGAPSIKELMKRAG
jgi:hypothetical protein